MREILCCVAVLCILSGCASSGPLPLLNPQVVSDLASPEYDDNIAGLETLLGEENTTKVLNWWRIFLDAVRFGMEK